MSKLDDYRNEIDAIDQKIKDFFVQRMELASLIGAYKKEHNLPIENKKREEEMIEAITNDESFPTSMKKYYIDLVKEMIKLSKSYQSELSK